MSSAAERAARTPLSVVGTGDPSGAALPQQQLVSFSSAALVAQPAAPAASAVSVLHTSFQEAVQIALNTSSAAPYKVRVGLLEDENPKLREVTLSGGDVSVSQALESAKLMAAAVGSEAQVYVLSFFM
jgi:hypothetical protein